MNSNAPIEQYPTHGGNSGSLPWKMNINPFFITTFGS